MSIKITSKVSKEIFLQNIEKLYKHNKWYSLPKGIKGTINNNKILLCVESGAIFWLGRGKIEGTLRPSKNGSTFEGELSSPIIATLLPLIIFSPLLYLAKNETLTIAIVGLLFCTFGYALVKSDHSQIIEALNEAAENHG